MIINKNWISSKELNLTLEITNYKEVPEKNN